MESVKAWSQWHEWCNFSDSTSCHSVCVSEIIANEDELKTQKPPIEQFLILNYVKGLA